nr:recombinase family protein [uncultured Blautia sp.]
MSRFSRNTKDTIKYVRMLRDKNIAILFEKENINTLDMNGEMLLTILSSLAQEEVESLSCNVKMGLQKKMKQKQSEWFMTYTCKNTAVERLPNVW